MRRFEIIIRQSRNGTVKVHSIDALARNGIDALISAISAIHPSGTFTAMVRPYRQGGNHA